MEAEVKKNAKEVQQTWDTEVTSIKEKRQADRENFVAGKDKDAEAKIK